MFEDRVLRQHFSGATVESWESDRDYHAYHLVNEIAVGRTIPVSRVWYEFSRRPAPTIGSRDTPVQTGDKSIAMAAPTMGRGRGIPVPLPGGPVTHYVDQSLLALINATTFGHVLHPGHIMRWIAVEPGPRFESHTVGRGTTFFTSANEIMGLEIFDELDMEIRAAL